jgi:hypothetical protein
MSGGRKSRVKGEMGDTALDKAVRDDISADVTLNWRPD